VRALEEGTDERPRATGMRARTATGEEKILRWLCRVPRPRFTARPWHAQSIGRAWGLSRHAARQRPSERRWNAPDVQGSCRMRG